MSSYDSLLQTNMNEANKNRQIYLLVIEVLGLLIADNERERRERRRHHIRTEDSIGPWPSTDQQLVITQLCH